MYRLEDVVRKENQLKLFQFKYYVKQDNAPRSIFLTKLRAFGRISLSLAHIHKTPKHKISI